MSATKPLTRREIMRKLGIKSKTTFRTLCKNGGVEPTGEIRERHLITFTYPYDCLDKIRKAIAEGDRRFWK